MPVIKATDKVIRGEVEPFYSGRKRYWTRDQVSPERAFVPLKAYMWCLSFLNPSPALS